MAAFLDGPSRRAELNATGHRSATSAQAIGISQPNL
jgi:hypothetical protein